MHLTKLSHRLPIVAMAAVLVLAAAPGAAGAYTTASGFVAQPYATGFPESSVNHWGPIGIAFDQSDNLYVADTADGNIYRFQPGGGVASAATRLTASPIGGAISGLAIAPSGAIYLARYSPGDVVQIDAETGRVLRRVATAACATGLAIDPISGDLFVSQNQCGSTVYRISGYSSGPGTATPYTSTAGVDGLAFDQSGTLYAESDGNILEIAGTNTATPGAVTDLASVPHADGLAFGAHASGQPSFLVANRNDGTVTRVEFAQSPPQESDIFTGGSRGDFAAVDSRGCLYITQSSSVVQISGPGQACAFEPSTQGAPPPPGVVVSVLGASRQQPKVRRGACTLLRSLKLRLRQRGRVRLRSATILVNGRRVRTLRGSRVTAPFVLTHLPRTSFTVRIVAITTRGRRLVSSYFYRNCAPRRRPRCTASRLILPVPKHRGARVVFVYEYVNGRLVRVVRGHSIRTVTLRGLPHGRFSVRLVSRDSRGRRATAIRRFVGC